MHVYNSDEYSTEDQIEDQRLFDLANIYDDDEKLRNFEDVELEFRPRKKRRLRNKHDEYENTQDVEY